MQFKHWGKLLLYIIIITTLQSLWKTAYDGKNNAFLGMIIAGPVRFVLRSFVSLVIFGISVVFLRWIKENQIIKWYAKLYVLFEIIALSFGFVRYFIFDHILILNAYAAAITLAMSPFCAILAYTSYYLKKNSTTESI